MYTTQQPWPACTTRASPCDDSSYDSSWFLCELQVADYAFTTLRPQLGMVQYSDSSALAVADIPGLIRGASQNRGLGHRFLRHVERSHALAYVLDLSSGVAPDNGPTPLEQFHMLQVCCAQEQCLQHSWVYVMIAVSLWHGGIIQKSCQHTACKIFLLLIALFW